MTQEKYITVKEIQRQDREKFLIALSGLSWAVGLLKGMGHNTGYAGRVLVDLTSPQYLEENEEEDSSKVKGLTQKEVLESAVGDLEHLLKDDLTQADRRILTLVKSQIEGVINVPSSDLGGER